MSGRAAVWAVLVLTLAAGPPLARRGSDTDTYHGVTVPDPYRWMEDLNSPETRDWIKAEDAYARTSVAGWTGRAAARAAMRSGTVPVTALAPVKEGGRYFSTLSRGSGPTLTFSLTVRDSPSAAPKMIIDADSVWSADSGLVRQTIPAPTGRLVAFGVSHGGSQEETFRIRDVETARDWPDRVDGVFSAGSVVWARTGREGFFYVRAVASGTNVPSLSRIYFHAVGASQSGDELVFERPDHPEWVLRHTVTDDGRYLVIWARIGIERRDRIFYRDLTRPESQVVPLIETAPAEFVFVGNIGPVLWFQTDYRAPRRRIIAIDLRHPDPAEWRSLIPEGPDAIDTWVGARAIGNRLLVAYRVNAVLVAKVYDGNGRFLYTLRFPHRYNSMWTLRGRQTDPEGFYVLQGVADPGTAYRVDVRTGVSTVFERPRLPYDPDDFVTEQVFVPRAGGVRVPMYVVRARGTRLDGSAPGIVYGYGFDSWAGSPWFQPMVTEWLREGGVWALANIRGGGEYGEAWAAAGRRRNKQTSIDDYLAAAEWLVAHRYVRKSGLVANSSSAGGVLAAAAIVQRPELFAAAILDYPVIDMFRYHRYRGGARWIKEYGTVDDSADFAALAAYSPYHGVRPGRCYPPTLLAPGELDQIAVPMHAYKFAAALQFANGTAPGCDNPILLRVSWGAGHSAGATPEDQIETWTDELAFLGRVVRLDQ